MSHSSGKGRRIILSRILIAIFVVFLLTFSAAAYLLRSGISIDSLNFGGIVVSNISLIWKEKIELQIEKISVNRLAKPEGKTSKLNYLRRGIKSAHYFARIISRFSIGSFTVDQNSFSVDLLQINAQTQTLTLNSDDLTLKSLLTFNKEKLDIDITEARVDRFNSDFKGNLQLDGKNDRITGTLTALINRNFPVSVDVDANEKQLSFHGKEAGEITEIKSLVDLFGLSHNIQRWITDYLRGSRYHLLSIKGTLPWNNPVGILSTLEAEVRVDDTEYTFAPGLEPIKARYTNVYFKQGILIIKPHDSSFYGQDGGESWLEINFNNPKNIVLTAFIKTRAVANEDILTLLDYYKIRLPFKQVGGLTAADLQLAIVLNKIHVEAEGIFEIDQGAIEWDGKEFQTKDVRITLKNSDVAIENLELSFTDVLMAHVTGSIQARNKTGDLDITFDKLILRNQKPCISLDPSVAAKVRYRFGPDGHFLEAHPSSWLLDSTRLNLGMLNGQVYLDDLAMDISPVQVAIPTESLAEISGYVSLRNLQVNLSCNLLDYHAGDLQLTSSPLLFDIQYDNGLAITVKEKSHWKINQMPVVLYPSEFIYHDNVFEITRSRISYGSLFDSYLSGYYDMNRKEGLFSLQEIDNAKDFLEKLELGSNADVEVSLAGNKLVVNFPNLNLQITTDEHKNWSVVVSDLSAIYSRSKVLRKYKIKEGSLSIFSKNGTKPYHVSADIKVPYPFLVIGGEPNDRVQLTGKLTEEGLFFKINRDLEAIYRNSHLTLKSRLIGYNISAIKELLRDLQAPEALSDKDHQDKQRLILELVAEDSQIYLSPQSRLLADTINLILVDGKLSAKLEHGPGQLQLWLENGTFLIEGNDLNDEFIGALIHNSRAQGGRMSLAAMGTFDEFSTILEMYDTNLSGLALINNVFAFLNTGPALMTFSLPEYNINGLPIDSAIAGLKFKGKVATFESLEVRGPEFQLKGAGAMDFAEQNIDMDLFIKLQAVKNVHKIPLIGQVLTSEDEDATLKLNISGDFDDPEVKNSLVNEIIAYPVEVLFRTLKLPFTITGELFNLESNDPVKSDTNKKN